MNTETNPVSNAPAGQPGWFESSWSRKEWRQARSHLVWALCSAGVLVALSTQTPRSFASETEPRVISDEHAADVLEWAERLSNQGIDALPVPRLSPSDALQLIIARNSEVRVGRLQVDIAGKTFDSEAALYETILFGTARREDRKRQRTVEERQINLQAAAVPILNEDIGFLEAGVRNRLSTGGEISLSLRQIQRSSNIIASNTSGRLDTEINSTMVLNLRQPLMRGRGQSITEVGKDVADLEYQMSRWQLRQVLQRAAGEALSTYWQLYRSQEAVKVRQDALGNARRILDETQARVRAGRSAEASLLEAKSAVLTREADVQRADMLVAESQARLLTLLNLQGLRLKRLEATPAVAYTPAPPKPNDEFASLESALKVWPPYQMAQLRLQQGERRLDFAKNQTDPQVDFQLNYAPSGLSPTRRDAFDRVAQSQNPELLLGFTMEIPLQGNLRANALYDAQIARVEQAGVEMSGAVANLANELTVRRAQLDNLQQEIQLLEADVSQRKQLLDVEYVRYDKGFSLLAQLLTRANDYSESRLRLLDAIMRHEQARIALLNADGSLFEHYGVVLKD